MDLLPVLRGGEQPSERTIFWRTTQTTRQGAVRRGGWKYLRDEDGEYLFDLVVDPGERRDRRKDEPARFDALKSAYSAWNGEMLQAVPLPLGV
jgi:arylsulfatase A-like enzyme